MKIKLSLLIIDAVILSGSFFFSVHSFDFKGEDVLRWGVIVLAVKVSLFVRYGLYRAILRFAGMPLAATILKATTLAAVFIFVLSHLSVYRQVPSSSLFIDYLITTFFIGLVRFAPRYIAERKKSQGTKRILVYGTGELGEEVSRKLMRNSVEYQLIGFIGDIAEDVGKRLHNLPIVGTLKNLDKIVKEKDITELIIAVSSLAGERLREITRNCRKNHVLCRIVPSLSDILRKDVTFKDIDIEDILRRDPKDLDEFQIGRFIKKRTILITGAGGSIGSELARQCIRYEAAKLVLVDHSEYNIYSLQEELEGTNTSLRFYLCDVTVNNSMEKILRDERPSLFFHAAACKHVPIVEDNPFIGISTNVKGTIDTANLAEAYGVEKYVLVSTDKAVRPTSIMGASKRIAELYIQNLNLQSETEFLSVRFGNVLGSSGSVIPKFIEQINSGGPVTVTHPDVTRYFMLISEAVQLVLQAVSIGKGGEIFILNMGQPVKITEMAEDLIFLSGREPHKDIKIEYIGLRPGEKLYEETLLDESEKQTQYENITIGRSTYIQWEWLMRHVEILLEYSREHNRSGLLAAIKMLVPEFQHASMKRPQDSQSEEFLFLQRRPPVVSQ